MTGNENFESLVKSLNKHNNLKTLNNLWRKAHQLESDESFKKTTVYQGGHHPDPSIVSNGMEKNSFVEDGIVNPDKYGMKTKVLFILKEANIFKTRDSKPANQRSQISWYHNFGNEKNDESEVDNIFEQGKALEYSKEKDKYISVDNRPKQLEKIGRMYLNLCTSEEKNNIQLAAIDGKNSYHEAINYISFINLNKRGGDNISQIVEEYAKVYAPFIKKQILLLDPEFIICCGKGTMEIVQEIIPDFKSIMISMWHTSYVNRQAEIDTNLNIGIKDKNVRKYMTHYCDVITEYLNSHSK